MLRIRRQSCDGQVFLSHLFVIIIILYRQVCTNRADGGQVKTDSAVLAIALVPIQHPSVC
jgi:hypothetical protein